MRNLTLVLALTLPPSMVPNPKQGTDVDLQWVPSVSLQNIGNDAFVNQANTMHRYAHMHAIFALFTACTTVTNA